MKVIDVNIAVNVAAKYICYDVWKCAKTVTC